MEENIQKNRTNNADKASNVMRAIFGIIMVAVYMAVGILFCVNDFFGSVGNHIVALVIGILLIIYGIWRGYRLWRNWP